ncbi:MAG: 16S rRNA (guanine(966)-N(2))-methyltransferase RsmD [Burkholderiaceae bacterium]
MPASKHEVRIVGGIWKRSKLAIIDRPGLRPTPDRVRETLFNWLGQDLSGWRCVDAFAGTGALGFEAASRGAREVLLVENDAGLLEQLKAAQTKLKASAVRIQRGDGIAVLRQLGIDSMDLVFLDPPFDSTFFEAALRAAASAVKSSGFVYLEAPLAWSASDLSPAGLVAFRHMKAGAVHAHLLRRAEGLNA